MFFGFISLCCHAIEAFSPKSMWIFTHFSTSTKLKICTWIFNLLMIHFHKIWPDHSVSLSVMTLFLSNVGSPFFPFNLFVYSWSHATLNNSSGFVKYFSFSFFFFSLRLHIYVLAYCICFSLSDLLHSVWQTLTPSTSLQITPFRFFLWLSIAFLLAGSSSLYFSLKFLGYPGITLSSQILRVHSIDMWNVSLGFNSSRVDLFTIWCLPFPSVK